MNQLHNVGNSLTCIKSSVNPSGSFRLLIENFIGLSFVSKPLPEDKFAG